ncbi:hypothetical protein G7K_3884-t1 [Saitoella complicata NRRL Y-17804]|uniref:Small ribosomal subunit protein mS35 mitochondrial conserved domain-containing protein n=2 Tax=Saitoella complicata (strain BCRC 22490 / CBS 7301 / JCM 7358 / NBRC 10748 / NRRL Y-17804) TaxID=698492 RepID=A0A0E9NJ62_SAICN|nr:hypothetical protein G7K_3884-t1 [Saitoella complicata NRRL Y-17804]
MSLLRRSLQLRSTSSSLNVAGASRAYASKRSRPNGRGASTDPIDAWMNEEGWENDMHNTAHIQLEQHRLTREYYRKSAYELPMLSQLSKPFKPPTQEQPLRFRYTSYLGEQHPAERKVVLEVRVKDLGLTDVQAHKLKLLAGARYDPTTDVMKTSCDSFSHRAQNKKFLSDQLDRLVAEAKDGGETFADIPLDTRHVKTKKKLQFPKEWLKLKNEGAVEAQA